MSIDKIYEYTKITGDAMYDTYGHILGHYFRNSYYVMKTIDSFNSNRLNDYRALYRAQFSRYEIALGLINALSSRSSVSMIDFIKKYDILKDLYQPDLYVFKLSNNKDLINELLGKASEHLRKKNR